MLQFLQNEVQHNQILSKETSKERYDKHTRPIYFKTGDLVAVKNYQAKSKFDKKFKGPYKVDTICDSNVKVIIGDKVRRYHYKDVKPYNTKLVPYWRPSSYLASFIVLWPPQRP